MSWVVLPILRKNVLEFPALHADLGFPPCQGIFYAVGMVTLTLLDLETPRAIATIASAVRGYPTGRIGVTFSHKLTDK